MVATTPRHFGGYRPATVRPPSLIVIAIAAALAGVGLAAGLLTGGGARSGHPQPVRNVRTVVDTRPGVHGAE